MSLFGDGGAFRSIFELDCDLHSTVWPNSIGAAGSDFLKYRQLRLIRHGPNLPSVLRTILISKNGFTVVECPRSPLTVPIEVELVKLSEEYRKNQAGPSHPLERSSPSA